MLTAYRLVWGALVSWPVLAACGASDASPGDERPDRCSDVTLLASTEGPIHAGTPVTLTAIADCPASAQPRYWFRALREGTAAWVDVAPKDTSDSQVEWDTSGLFSGRYRLAVSVRRDEESMYGVRREIEGVTVGDVCDRIVVTELPDSPPTQAMLFQIAASATCTGGMPEYKFTLEGGVPFESDWSTSSRLSVPAADRPSGRYSGRALARAAGNSSSYEAQVEFSLLIGEVCDDIVSLTASPPSPQPAGTPIIVRASAHCHHGQPEFQFVSDSDETAPFRDWGESAALWSEERAGEYRVTVRVRGVHNFSDYEAIEELGYRFIEPAGAGDGSSGNDAGGASGANGGASGGRAGNDTGGFGGVGSLCTPGVFSCDGGDVYGCDPSGTQLLFVEACDDGEHCRAGASACVPDLCTAGAALCAGDVATVCAPDGSGPASGGTDCSGLDQRCVLGACQPLVCAPQERFCEGGHVSLCNATGTAAAPYEDCLAEEYCDETGGRVACRPDLCNESRAACRGEQVAICNTDGSGFVSIGAACAPDAVCDLIEGCATEAIDTPGELSPRASSSGARLYLTLVEAAMSRRLRGLEAFLDLTPGTELTWLVYEASRADGSYVEIFSRSTRSAALSQTEPHASGPTDLELVSGRFYALGVAVAGEHGAKLGGAARLSFASPLGAFALPLDAGEAPPSEIAPRFLSRDSHLSQRWTSTR